MFFHQTSIKWNYNYRRHLCVLYWIELRMLVKSFLQRWQHKSFLKIEKKKLRFHCGIKNAKKLSRVEVSSAALVTTWSWSLNGFALFRSVNKEICKLQNSSRRGSHPTVLDVLNQCHCSSATAENDSRSHPFHVPTVGDWKQFLWR